MEIIVAMLVENKIVHVGAKWHVRSSINSSSCYCYNSEMCGPPLYLIIHFKSGVKYDLHLSKNKSDIRQVRIS